ncbi:DUF6020 family protein [Pseudoscardovia radai]|uniref:DUF6020 family protein n=1 Tax=Pseudoscardovia radai TaxID=987066 RepID=UPI0039923848
MPTNASDDAAQREDDTVQPEMPPTPSEMPPDQHSSSECDTPENPGVSRSVAMPITPSGGDMALCIVIGVILGTVYAIGHEFTAWGGVFTIRSLKLWSLAGMMSAGMAVVLYALLLAWNAYLRSVATRDAVSSSASPSSAARTPKSTRHASERRVSPSSHPASARPASAARRAFHVAARWLSGLGPHPRRALFLALILLCWIPAFIAFFPGNFNDDGPLQSAEFLNGHVINLQWPAAHTLILSACLRLGFALAGTGSAGVTIYAVLQSVLMAFALAFAADRLLRWRVPGIVVTLAMLVTVANPVVQAFAMSTVKDALFSAFFVIVAVLVADVLRRPMALKSAGFTAFFVLNCAMAVLLRKQMLYVFLIVAVILLIVANRGKARLYLARAIAIVLAVVLVFNTVIGLFPTRKPGIRDMVSVPDQQIAAVFFAAHDSLSAGDMAAIGEYYETDLWQEAYDNGPVQLNGSDVPSYLAVKDGLPYGYLPFIADYANWALKDDALKANPAGFLALWMRLGREYPGIYAQALVQQENVYFYPGAPVEANTWVAMSGWNSVNFVIEDFGDKQPVDYHTVPGKPAGLVAWYDDAALRLFRGHGLLARWVAPGLVFTILLVSLAMTLARRKFRLRMVWCVVPWLVVALYWCTSLLAPVASIRLALPTVVTIPVLLCLPWMRAEKADDAPAATPAPAAPAQDAQDAR